MAIAMMVGLIMSQEGDCSGTCPNPVGLMHPQSVDHTRGGTCRTCLKVIDSCFVLCADCAGDLCVVCGRKAGNEVKVERKWSGGDSKIEKPEVIRITDAKSWDELWKRHAGQRAPEVDFEKSMVVAIFRGKILVSSTTELVGVREFSGRIALTVQWAHPNCGNEPEITDYLFVKLPRSAKKLRAVSVEWTVQQEQVRKVLAEFKPL